MARRSTAMSYCRRSADGPGLLPPGGSSCERTGAVGSEIGVHAKPGIRDASLMARPCCRLALATARIRSANPGSGGALLLASTAWSKAASASCMFLIALLITSGSTSARARATCARSERENTGRCRFWQPRLRGRCCGVGRRQHAIELRASDQELALTGSHRRQPPPARSTVGRSRGCPSPPSPRRWRTQSASAACRAR